MGDVARTLRDSLQLHRALPVERDALLAEARRGALAGRGLILLGEGLANDVPAGLTPYPALRALERLTCSLVAHAQSPPDRTGALRPAELDAVIDAALHKWIERCLPLVAEAR
jgi:hypothetical protein